MEKIIVIKYQKDDEVNEYRFAAKSTAASLISYKANFGRDGLKDLIKLAKGIEGDTDPLIILESEGFDFDIFYRFLWVFAKAGEKTIPPFEQWLEAFEMSPIDFAVQTLPQVIELLGSTVGSTVKSKN